MAKVRRSRTWAGVNHFDDFLKSRMNPYGFNYVHVRIANILIGSLCIFLELYAMIYSRWTEAIDKVFIGINLICVLEAFSLLLLIQSNKTWEFVWRITCSVGLFTISILLLSSAGQIQERICLKLSVQVAQGIRCQFYGMKISAAIIAMINGAIYPWAKVPEPDVIQMIVTRNRGVDVPDSCPPQHNNPTLESTNDPENNSTTNPLLPRSNPRSIRYPWGYQYNQRLPHPLFDPRLLHPSILDPPYGSFRPPMVRTPMRPYHL